MGGTTRAPSVEYQWLNDPEEAEKKRVRAIKYIVENAALRTVGKTLTIDAWPIYLLEDVAIHKGKEFGNLLNAELEGEFVVRGKLVVGRDQIKDLRNVKVNNSYIEFKCSSFSIGAGPTTLWAIGLYKYFEIRPSRSYRDMYRHMTEGIGIYFHLEQVYLDAKSKKKGLPIEKVLFEYAYLDGRGLSMSSCVARIKQHGEFLLAQMRKAEEVNWPVTEVFKWLSYECSDTYMKLVSKSGEAIKHPPPVHLPTRQPSASNSTLHLYTPKPVVKSPRPVKISPPGRSRRSLGSPSDVDEEMNDAVQLSRRKLKGKSSVRMTIDLTADDTPGPSEASGRGFKPPFTYSGPIVIPTTRDTKNPVGIFLTLIYASAHHDIKMVPEKFFSKPETLTYKKISTALYNLYKIKSHEAPPISDQLFANLIMEYYARAIITSLHPSWKSTLLYHSLADIARAQKSWTTQEKERNRWPEIARFTIERRAHKLKFDQWTGTQGKSSATPPPHAGKTALPPHVAGHRSGKQAGLRLASVPLKRDSEAVSSSATPELEDTRPGKKRRRAVTPPEMGPSSSSELDDSHPDSDSEATPKLQNLTLNSTPITQEGCFISGRMGSWVCSYCSFPVYDPKTPDGLAMARQHMLDEAERITREDLVAEEAAKTRLPSTHLLDLIRERGREARLKAEAERMVSGKMAPEPIKRARV